MKAIKYDHFVFKYRIFFIDNAHLTYNAHPNIFITPSDV
jgi:hypothetical protein